jgi:hypothetical protein
MLKLKWALHGMLVMVAITACVKAPTQVPYQESEWVRLGSGAYRTEQGRFFYGVASASGLSSQLLLRATADNLARDELFTVLETYAGLLVGRSAADGAGPAGQDSMLSLVQESLQQATIEDHWFDDRNGHLYALCSVDLNTFKEALARHDYLEMSLRNTLLGRADNVHDQMAAQKPSQ